MTKRGILLRVAGGLVALVMLYCVAVAAGRWWPLPDAEREAIARLEAAKVPPVRRDAGEYLWLSEHDVPASERAEAARAIVAFLAAHPHETSPRHLPDSPLRRYSKLAESPPPGEGVCDLDAFDCLSYVRRDAARVEATLAAHRREIAAGSAIRQYNGFRYPLAPDIHNPSPSYGVHRRLVFTDLARAFAQGRQVEAIADTCSDLAAWRRMNGGTDTLIGNMISIAFVRQDAVLLSQMLAELPADVELPVACGEALAPARDAELDMCPALGYELRHLRSYFSEEEPAGADFLRVGAANAWVDRRRIASRMALGLDVHCGPQALANARQDRSAAPRERAPACNALSAFLDPIGCSLSDIQAPTSFSGYVDRRTDTAAALALLRTADWLGRQPGSTAERRALLARRPAELGLLRTPELSGDGRSISFALLQPWKGDRITMAVRPPPPAAGD
jgi:hypothetical protein